MTGYDALRRECLKSTALSLLERSRRAVMFIPLHSTEAESSACLEIIVVLAVIGRDTNVRNLWLRGRRWLEVVSGQRHTPDGTVSLMHAGA